MYTKDWLTAIPCSATHPVIIKSHAKQYSYYECISGPKESGFLLVTLDMEASENMKTNMSKVYNSKI